jgi:hypothetical protein
MTGGQKTVCCWDGTCKGRESECSPNPNNNCGLFGCSDSACGFLGLDCLLSGVADSVRWIFIGVVILLVLLIALNFSKRR